MSLGSTKTLIKSSKKWNNAFKTKNTADVNKF